MKNRPYSRSSDEDMKDWEPDIILKQFTLTACGAENYAKELADRIKRNPTGYWDREKELHDEHLARWLVYDSFSFTLFLESREKLIAEARARLATKSERYPIGVFNKDNFDKYWRQYMNELIDAYKEWR